MMGQLWKREVVCLILINLSRFASCSPLDEAESVRFSDDILYPNTEDQNHLDKRLSSFVRIGRGLSSFIRIGRSNPEYALFETEPAENDDESEGNFQKRKSAFVRIGRGNEPESSGNVPSFQSIWSTGYETEPYAIPLDKRGGAFIRLGKFPSAGFVRNRSGRIHSISSPPYYRRSGRIGHSSFIRIGKRDTRNALREIDNQGTEKEVKAYLSLRQRADTETGTTGKSPNEKRMSSFVRIGRQRFSVSLPDLYRLYAQAKNSQLSASEPTSKVAVSPTEKRMSSFVRIGRQAHEPLPRHLYQDNLHPEEKEDTSRDEVSPTEKRMSGFVRIGRQAHEPLPRHLYLDNLHPEEKEDTSRDEDLTSQDTNKRISSFVRIGKDLNSFDGADKRMSSFVRIGKSNRNDMRISDEKRMSKFVRIGKDYSLPFEDLSSNDKRYSKFVRIGKALSMPLDETEYSLTPETDLNKHKQISKGFEFAGDDLDRNMKGMGNFVSLTKDIDLPDDSMIRGNSDDANTDVPNSVSDRSPDLDKDAEEIEAN